MALNCGLCAQLNFQPLRKQTFRDSAAVRQAQDMLVISCTACTASALHLALWALARLS